MPSALSAGVQRGAPFLQKFTDLCRRAFCINAHLTFKLGLKSKGSAQALRVRAQPSLNLRKGSAQLKLEL